MVVSDHAPCTPDLKTITSKVTLMSAWGGISSLQYGLPLMWTEGRKRGLTIQDVLRLMSAGPAKLAQLESRKSKIQAGFDADFVIWVSCAPPADAKAFQFKTLLNFQDPLATFTITKGDIKYKNKLSPYLNRTLAGVVKQTVVGGKVVFNEGVVSDQPLGKLLL